DRVRNYPIFFLYKGERTIRDSRNPTGLSAQINLAQPNIIATYGERVKIVINIENTSAKVWRASGPKFGCVNVGAMLSRRGGSDLGLRKEYRFSLSHVDV